jgi:hypothetical protein
MTTKISTASAIIRTLTPAARANVRETGADVAEDLRTLRLGTTTRDELLAHCLDGADDDRIQGWRDYVATLAEAAEVGDDEIRELRAEAGEAGDLAQVAICDLALCGDDAARAECVRVILTASADDHLAATP